VIHSRKIESLRRSAIVNLTLTDILIVLLFVLLLFTFRAKEEGLKDIPALQAQVEALRKENQRLAAQLNDARNLVTALEQKVKEQEEFIARLLTQSPEGLPVDSRAVLARLTKEIETLREMNRVLIEEKRALEARLAKYEAPSRGLVQGGKGTGYPRCAVTSGFLLEVTLLEDGSYVVQPAWDQNSERQVRVVPGLEGLSGPQKFTSVEFQRFAEGLFGWGDAQEPACRFHVLVKTQTRDLGVFQAQMRRIDRYFYPRRY
jgi:cell division protein FtsB